MSDIDEIQTLKEEVETLKTAFTNSDGSKKKLRGVAKYFTLSVLGLITVFGLIGNFAWMHFNMQSFIQFLPVFAPILGVFVISIGADGVVKRINEGKEKK